MRSQSGKGISCSDWHLLLEILSGIIVDIQQSYSIVSRCKCYEQVVVMCVPIVRRLKHGYGIS